MLMYLIYHLQFTQEIVDKPTSVGEIAYPPRIAFEFEFTLTSTAEATSFSSTYIFQVLGMSMELNFPCRLRPAQLVSGGIYTFILLTLGAHAQRGL